MPRQCRQAGWWGGEGVTWGMPLLWWVFVPLSHMVNMQGGDAVRPQTGSRDNHMDSNSNKRWMDAREWGMLMMNQELSTWTPGEYRLFWAWEGPAGYDKNKRGHRRQETKSERHSHRRAMTQLWWMNKPTEIPKQNLRVPEGHPWSICALKMTGKTICTGACTFFWGEGLLLYQILKGVPQEDRSSPQRVLRLVEGTL